MRTLICVFLCAALSVSFVSADEVNKANKKANKLYSQGKYEEALKLYDDALLLDPSDGKLKMNKGSALYRLNEFDEAENSYLDALSSLKDKKAQADAHYNLGNVQYKQGEALEAQGNAASARGKYSQALENYINTLKLRPNDKDAKWNLQLAHQKVNVLQNQEDQNQENKDKQDNKDDKKEDKSGEQDDKKDDKQDSQNNKDEQNKDDQQKQDGQSQEQNEQDMKKEEAERLIEQYADDSDSLNKPAFRGKVKQPEKDW